MILAGGRQFGRVGPTIWQIFMPYMAHANLCHIWLPYMAKPWGHIWLPYMGHGTFFKKNMTWISHPGYNILAKKHD
jgi:hypothetical protein